MSLTVDIAGLKTACSDLEKSRQEIMDSYNKQVKSVLENSNSCFYVAGNCFAPAYFNKFKLFCRQGLF